MNTLTSWRLLPDEQLRADAGTDKVTWRDGMLHASLNAAAFVSFPSADVPLDLEAFADCLASLATPCRPASGFALPGVIGQPRQGPLKSPWQVHGRGAHPRRRPVRRPEGQCQPLTVGMSMPCSSMKLLCSTSQSRTLCFA